MRLAPTPTSVAPLMKLNATAPCSTGQRRVVGQSEETGAHPHRRSAVDENEGHRARWGGEAGRGRGRGWVGVGSPIEAAQSAGWLGGWGIGDAMAANQVGRPPDTFRKVGRLLSSVHPTQARTPSPPHSARLTSLLTPTEKSRMTAETTVSTSWAQKLSQPTLRSAVPAASLRPARGGGGCQEQLVSSRLPPALAWFLCWSAPSSGARDCCCWLLCDPDHGYL